METGDAFGGRFFENVRERFEQGLGIEGSGLGPREL
jgi:hypothetical protein